MTENPTFEQAVERLEEVVRLLESGDLPLERSLALFEEGTRLAAFCGRRLEDAEQKLVELSALGEPGKEDEAGPRADGED